MAGIVKPFISFVSLIACATLIHCVKDPTLTGGGSETTNGVTIIGKIHNSDATPANKAVVRLFRIDLNIVADSVAGKAFIDTTDSSGAFKICRVDSGTYNILARNDNSSTGLLVPDIHVKADDSLVTAPPGNLQKTGAIAVDLSGAAVQASSREYLFIRGTDIYSYVNGQKVVILDKIPEGIVPAVSFATATGADSGIIRYNISVRRRDTVIIKNAAWRHSRRVCFNTTGTGAGVTSDVYNFPVCIRLNAGNFDFSQARKDGSDLRFTEGDKPFLPFEIERYDPASELAEVWVKIDTVFGNDTNQALTMYWGASAGSATSPSDGAAVFDTAAGFQGVWHFAGPVDDSVKDATNNRYNGVDSGMSAASLVDGVIGKCREFDGVGSCVIMPNTANGKLNFSANGIYTVSAWVSVDSLDSGSHVVISKGAFQYYLWFSYIYQNAPNWEFVKYDKTSGWRCPTFPVVSKKWVLLTGVSAGSSQYLYVNGELSDTTIQSYPYTEPRDTSTNFIIGRYAVKAGYPPGKLGGYCFFGGKIDEVRVYNRSQNADWNRLCYMNQRIDDKLITFK